ncbi:hypothetical protein P691DRAFT_787126 [Macrolepiota fuliginosa MF-IS2]|uniref:Uncharacterized protein n=1 Tax=Macrolepiota fuliginosa MF-IS2 TaxID=1400762 RepID=A0A9P6C087_9AGAR|nr:hypothetical protein P691DRAFT_787126 [Macrolepiota fuliginosa MF-IS2]
MAIRGGNYIPHESIAGLLTTPGIFPSQVQGISLVTGRSSMHVRAPQQEGSAGTGLHLLHAATDPTITLYSAARRPPPRYRGGQYQTEIAQPINLALNDGCGKFAHAQFTAEALDRNKKLACATFLSPEKQDINIRYLIPTVSYQIAMREPVFGRFPGSRIHDNPALLDEALPQQFRFADSGNKISRQVIIVDALEWYNDVGAQMEVVKLITEHVTSPFLWVFFSRQECHLRSIFTTFNATVLELPISRDLVVEIEHAALAIFQQGD